MEKKISKLTATRDGLVQALVAQKKTVPPLREPDAGSYLRTWLRLHLDIFRLKRALRRKK